MVSFPPPPAKNSLRVVVVETHQGEHKFQDLTVVVAVAIYWYADVWICNCSICCVFMACKPAHVYGFFSIVFHLNRIQSNGFLFVWRFTMHTQTHCHRITKPNVYAVFKKIVQSLSSTHTHTHPHSGCWRVLVIGVCLCFYYPTSQYSYICRRGFVCPAL